ncbi:MAG: Hsp20/alpha crystallin family protein [Gammaproteobacteria bacterium]|nr:Hsp20/alpha crystallin family protein [Gammaproteobacteria bacterium]
MAIRQQLNRAWEHLADGWRHLTERASHALTHFHPHREPDGSDEVHQLVSRSARWALLSAEVADNDNEVSVRLEVPGMDKQGFDIEVDEQYLVVRGEKRAQHSGKRGHYHITECAYGSFERAIPLPSKVEADQARAVYKQGVLYITLPKMHKTVKRKIDVSAA